MGLVIYRHVQLDGKHPNKPTYCWSGCYLWWVKTHGGGPDFNNKEAGSDGHTSPWTHCFSRNWSIAIWGLIGASSKGTSLGDIHSIHHGFPWHVSTNLVLASHWSNHNTYPLVIKHGNDNSPVLRRKSLMISMEIHVLTWGNVHFQDGFP